MLNLGSSTPPDRYSLWKETGIRQENAERLAERWHTVFSSEVVAEYRTSDSRCERRVVKPLHKGPLHYVHFVYTKGPLCYVHYNFTFFVGIYDSDEQARALNHLIKKLPDAVIVVMKYLFKFLFT